MASVIRGSDNFDSLVHQCIGVNQTWQDVTASRAASVTYTNSTGKPIMVNITTPYAANSDMSFFVDGKNISAFTFNGTTQVQWTTSAIVPNNSTYYAVKGDSSSFTWFELR